MPCHISSGLFSHHQHFEETKLTANSKDKRTPPWKNTLATVVESPASAPDMKLFAGKTSNAALPRVKMETQVKPGTPVATRYVGMI
jgi:hypothetical protein